MHLSWSQKCGNSEFWWILMIFKQNDGFYWILMIFRISVTNSSAYNSTKLFVWSIQNVLLVTRMALAHRAHPLGLGTPNPNIESSVAKRVFCCFSIGIPTTLTDTFGKAKMLGEWEPTVVVLCDQCTVLYNFWCLYTSYTCRKSGTIRVIV